MQHRRTAVTGAVLTCLVCVAVVATALAGCARRSPRLHPRRRHGRCDPEVPRLLLRSGLPQRARHLARHLHQGHDRRLPDHRAARADRDGAGHASARSWTRSTSCRIHGCTGRAGREAGRSRTRPTASTSLRRAAPRRSSGRTRSATATSGQRDSASSPGSSSAYRREAGVQAPARARGRLSLGRACVEPSRPLARLPAGSLPRPGVGGRTAQLVDSCVAPVGAWGRFWGGNVRIIRVLTVLSMVVACAAVAFPAAAAAGRPDLEPRLLPGAGSFAPPAGTRPPRARAFVPGQLLVEFRAGVSGAEAAGRPPAAPAVSSRGACRRAPRPPAARSSS